MTQERGKLGREDRYSETGGQGGIPPVTEREVGVKIEQRGGS